MSFGQRDYDRTKPEIDFPGETPPTELVVEDLIEGSGPAVEAGSRVQVVSLEPEGFNHSFVEGPQVAAALLATHLNGERLDLDHGYPLRLIAPNRAGVLNTKWLTRIEVLS